MAPTTSHLDLYNLKSTDYLFLFSQLSKKIKLLIFFGSITVFSFFIHQNVQIKNRMIMNTIESINSSETIYFSPGHKKHLDNAIELFKNKPISGHGTNNFRRAWNSAWWEEKTQEKEGQKGEKVVKTVENPKITKGFFQKDYEKWQKS